jgi:hypothetical protein
MSDEDHLCVNAGRCVSEAVTIAAEVLADHMKMNDPKYPKAPVEPIKTPPWATEPVLEETEQVIKSAGWRTALTLWGISVLMTTIVAVGSFMVAGNIH